MNECVCVCAHHKYTKRKRNSECERKKNILVYLQGLVSLVHYEHFHAALIFLFSVLNRISVFVVAAAEPIPQRFCLSSLFLLHRKTENLCCILCDVCESTTCRSSTQSISRSICCTSKLIFWNFSVRVLWKWLAVWEHGFQYTAWCAPSLNSIGKKKRMATKWYKIVTNPAHFFFATLFFLFNSEWNTAFNPFRIDELTIPRCHHWNHAIE